MVLQCVKVSTVATSIACCVVCDTVAVLVATFFNSLSVCDIPKELSVVVPKAGVNSTKDSTVLCSLDTSLCYSGADTLFGCMERFSHICRSFEMHAEMPYGTVAYSGPCASAHVMYDVGLSLGEMCHGFVVVVYLFGAKAT